MKKSFKKNILSAPVLGNMVVWLTSILKIREMYSSLTSRLSELESENISLKNSLSNELDSLNSQTNSLTKNVDNLNQKFSLSLVNNTRNSNQPTPKQGLFAEDHIADAFYSSFEDKFRGSETEIKKRLKEDYLTLFKEAVVDLKKHRVLDIGSGRGEFLGLMKDSGLKAIGLDINIDMVERANKLGLETIQGNAIEFLLKSGPQTFGAITGFHIVEHIPFNQLLTLFTAAHSALTKDGFVLFETPNPENVVVGSYSFYLDPSHLNPVPPALLAFALENCGFRNIKILRLHPPEEIPEQVSELPDDLIEKMYGPRDYSVIAYK